MARSTPRAARWRSENEAGQMLVLFAFGLIAFCGAVAMSIDVGHIVVTRRNLQNSADAAALAAAQKLPSTAEATALGGSYVDQNLNASGTLVGTPGVVITFASAYTANDTVRVTVSRPVSYSFGRALGLESTTVTATATARVAYYNGGSGVQPWGLVADGSSSCISGSGGSMTFTYNTSCILKEGAPGSGGDFGALQLDGSGASEYREDIEQGSDTTFSIGDTIEPETGNMAGPTKQGIEARLALPRPSGCTGESYDDLTNLGEDGTVSIVPGCEEHPRFILIPIVDQIDHKGVSTILGFAVMYLEGVSQSGGHTEVYGKFINLKTPLPGGDYTGSSTNAPSMIILTE